MNAKIITIGDELLIGQVIDSNSAWIGAELEKINIKVTEIRSIQDNHKVIIDTLEELTGKSDILIFTGGLGPTKDDVTKKALADFMSVDLVFHQESYDRLVNLFERLNYQIRESHKSQAYVPENCTVLVNKMGTAQGMWMEKNETIIISTPGVPYEMKYILEHGALPKLAKLNPAIKIQHKTIMTAGWGETMIEEHISDIVAELPEHVRVAYLPGLGRVRVRVSSFGGSDQSGDANLFAAKIADRLGNIVYGYDDISLMETTGNLLVEKQLTLGTAESCTGGYLAHLITSVPGSSRYYNGSVIAYANEVKVNQLMVDPDTLVQYGAVSEETVKEMVSGLVKNFNVDVAIATSGIAGPSGGTPEKPVGTIWICCGNQEEVVTRKLQLTKNRSKNIEYTSLAALNMLRKFLSGV